MVTLGALWLPIVLSAVFVFVASSIIHMVLQYHKASFRAVPDERTLMEALKKCDVPPGQYILPHCADMKEQGTPEFRKKFEEGPTGLLTVGPRRAPNMAKSLIQWFVYCLGIGLFVAYIAAVTLEPGTPYLTVFRVVGTAAILGYGGAVLTDSIWMAAPWANTLRHVLDAAIYGILTAGTFGWLWPQ